MFLRSAVIPISLSFAATIPLVTIRDRALPVVSVTTGSHAPSEHKIYIGSNVITHISDTIPEHLRHEAMRSFLTPSRFEGSDVMLVMEAREGRVGPDAKSIGDWLAIGPTSDLVDIFGSVSLVRHQNSTLLLMGSLDHDSFVADYCEPADSFVRVPISQFPLVTMDGDPAHFIGSSGSLEVNGIKIFGEFKFTPIDQVLRVGILTIMSFFASFIQRGLVQTNPADLTLSLLSCEPDVIAQLPNIIAIFGTNDDTEDVVSRRLVLTPTDYISRNPDDTCRMRISIFNEFYGDYGTFFFNPVAIPGMIARSTNDDMVLCRAK